MSGVEGADKLDLLAGNARYKKLADLNEGTFGVVMLALDRRTNEQVCLQLCITGVPVAADSGSSEALALNWAGCVRFLQVAIKVRALLPLLACAHPFITRVT